MPAKSNTVASGAEYKQLNSSQNPVADLWYGGSVLESGINRNSISRHLIYFDLSDLQSKMTDFTINSGNVTSYKLKLKNCLPSSKILTPEYEFNILNKTMAHSFDLIAFPIDKFWDEGRGYDLDEMHYIKRSRGDIRLEGVSNWLSATTTTPWTSDGILDNPTASTSNYATQHFSTGAEDINMDITAMVNSWLSGGSTNYGLCLAYARPFELTSSTTRYIASFFTHKTNSSFKPYIEVNYNQEIQDDRLCVSNNRLSRLFLYLFSGNTPVNYYSAGTVTIKNSSNTVIYSGITPTHFAKGVYYIDVFMSGTTKGQKFKDVWQNISFNPLYDSQDITNSFDIKDNYYLSNANGFNEYSLSYYGITNNQKIRTDEITRVYIDARKNYSSQRPYVDYGLQYMITMNNVTDVIPWTSVNNCVIDNNLTCYFDLDASWLLTEQTYQITFRIKEFGSIKVLHENIYFKVVDAFTSV
jgi:hypothetical protein